MSKLYWRFGPMNCGKSAQIAMVAFNYRSIGKTPFVIKPAIDTRSSRSIISRIGALSLTADIVTHPGDNLYGIIHDLEQKPDVVIVDEAQWLTTDQVDQLFLVAVELDIPVMCYGLRTDYRGELWRAAGRLFALAHDIQELKMVCHCGRKAMFTHMTADPANAVIDDNGEPILIGASESYDALCAEHFINDTTYDNSLTNAVATATAWRRGAA